MNNKCNYVIITPVRDEAQHIAKTIESVTSQTVLPSKWVIVDDGSTDGTSEILDARASQTSWIDVIHRVDRGWRSAGSGMIEAFYAGYSRLPDDRWDFI